MPTMRTLKHRAGFVRPQAWNHHPRHERDQERRKRMYIGGGVLTLIVIILLLIWLF